MHEILPEVLMIVADVYPASSGWNASVGACDSVLQE